VIKERPLKNGTKKLKNFFLGQKNSGIFSLEEKCMKNLLTLGKKIPFPFFSIGLANNKKTSYISLKITLIR